MATKRLKPLTTFFKPISSMSPPENLSERQATKQYAPRPPHQRPGKLGVDYDEYGKEMAPNARVWKKYVEETDKMDKELVDGWNRLLDLILIFAALFSAILTAFVVESSKDLKPDPAKASAQTLQLISQILLASSTGSPTNLSTSIDTETPPLTPTRLTVLVNALWFTSLSLSVAVSLFAILAKEWCNSFISGRLVSIPRQGRLRQQRWDGIERWKMKEVLSLLPLLMHTALLFFAIGLSIYLWNINVQVALPVVIIAISATLFYLAIACLPLFFNFFPYRTAISTFLYPVLIPIVQGIGYVCLLLAWLFGILLYGVSRLLCCTWRTRVDPGGARSSTTTRNSHRWHYTVYPEAFNGYILGAADRIVRWGQDVQAVYLKDQFTSVEHETPMDNVTSSMLSWMISNCKDPQSVDLALQALAGATLHLPRASLWDCNAIQHVAQRLRFCLDTLDNLHTGNNGLKQDNLLDEACLYSRSLNFLTESIQGKTFGTVTHRCNSFGSDIEYMYRPRGPVGSSYTFGCVYSNSLLSHAFDGPTPRYEIAALELNNMLYGIMTRKSKARGSTDDGLHRAEDRQQFSRQQDLLKHITGQSTTLPLAAMLALVNGFTKSYLYNPRQPLCLLVDLLVMNLSQTDKPALRHAIGISLTVAAFANHDFPGGETATNHHEARLQRARQVYRKLEMGRPGQQTKPLLVFGLLGLLMQPTKEASHSEAGIKSIHRALDILLDTHGRLTYQNIIPTLPPTFDCSQHFQQIAFSWLSTGSEDSDTLGPSSPPMIYLDAVLRPALCKAFGTTELMILLINVFTDPKPLPEELKRMCLLGYVNCADKREIPRPAIQKLAGIGIERLLWIATSTHPTAPYYMRFIWTTSIQLLLNIQVGSIGSCEDSRSILRILHDRPAGANLLHGGEPPRNVGEMQFVEKWIPNLTNMCGNKIDAQNVLESGILSAMVQFYREGRDGDTPSPTTELPNRFSHASSWLTILRELEVDCEAAVAHQIDQERGNQENDTEREPKGSPRGRQSASPAVTALDFPI